MVIAVVSSVIALVLLVFGPMSMRNDLRSELLHLSLLKTLPLRGRDIVLAEVSSSVLPVAIMEYLLVLAALVSLGYANSTAMTPPIRFALALAAPVLLLGLSGAVFTIHNALALFFPGWVKLGATGATGIETIGMGMMTMLIVLVMLALMLVVPVIAAGIAWSVLRYQPSSALFASGLVAGLLLLAESVLLSLVLGGALDRIEPMQVG